MFKICADSIDFVTPEIQEKTTNISNLAPQDQFLGCSSSKFYTEVRAARRRAKVDQERNNIKLKIEIDELDQPCGPSKETYVQRISTLVRARLDFTKKSIREHSKAELEAIKVSIEVHLMIICI